MQTSRNAMRLSSVAVLLLLALFVGDCGGGPEYSILQGYFQAARLRDRTTLGNIATVSFDPNREGQVERFQILSLGLEDTRTLQLRESAKAYQDASAASEELGKKMKAYQDDHLEAIDRVLKAERSKGKVAGADVEVQTTWTKFREDTSQSQKRLTEARTKLSDERGLAELSVMTGGQTDVDVTTYDGLLASKDVTINATVRTPDGQTSQKQLVVTLTQARLKNEKGELTGRWIVTGIKEG